MSKTIVYLGNFGNKFSDTSEQHIQKALEDLGHKVIPVDEKDFDILKISNLCRDEGDMFLFHKGGQAHDVPMEDLVKLLNFITVPKVFWYFDKVYGDREHWMHTIIPYVDHGFMTDGTWLRRQNYKNISVLNQGIGGDTSLGEFKEKYACDIAFFGSIYNDKRASFVRGLQEAYKERFRVFSDVFGKELKDACASAKIVVSPRSPQDDFYWSSRVYQTTGSGGFMLYPKLEGLKEEFTDKEIQMYATGMQLKEKIDYYLEHEDERKAIQKAGYEKTTRLYTYKNRLKNMLIELTQKGII